MICNPKNILVIMGIFVAGLSFGISQNDHTDTRDNRGTFVCNQKTIAPKSRETRQYYADIAEQKYLLKRQQVLLAKPNVAQNTCNNLKKREQIQCRVDIAVLKTITRELVSLTKRIGDYESCYLAPKCGSAINDVFFAPPSENLCSSGNVRGDITFNPLVLGVNGEPVWKWECSNSQGNKVVSCFAQSIMAYGWSIGEWSECSNAVQYRTINCSMSYNQEIINISYCGEPLESSRACDDIANISIQSSYYSDVLDAANMLADRRIITNYTSNPTQYLWNNPINKQDLLAMVLKAMKLAPAADYQCQNIFGDISESSVCAVAETALANGLIIKRTNEEGVSLFRGTDNLSIYEMFVLTMKSQCMGPESSSVTGVQSMAGNLGITNASTLNMIKAASRGDTYISLATFIDYFNRNVGTDPGSFDTSIVGCADRIDRSDEDVLCSLFPDLCQ